MCWCVAKASDSAFESTTSCAVQVHLQKHKPHALVVAIHIQNEYIDLNYTNGMSIYILYFLQYRKRLKYAHSRFQMFHAATTMVRKHGYSALLHLPACRVWHVHDTEDTPWEPCLAILSFANFDLLQRSFTWGKPREKNDMEMPRCVTLKVHPWASTVLDLYIYVPFLFFWLSYTFHVAMAQPLQFSWWLRYNGESQWHGSPPSSANCFTFRLRMREPSPGQQDAQVGVNMEKPWR